MAIKYTKATNEAEQIADIIVTFSVVDDALCEYILDFPHPGEECKSLQEALSDDRSNIGIGDKIDFLIGHFPNLPDPNGNTIKNLKSDLVLMKRIRNEIAHNRRFSMKNGVFETLSKPNYKSIKTRPLSQLSTEFNQAFMNCNSLFEVIFAYDWEYRNAYLYGVGNIYE